MLIVGKATPSRSPCYFQLNLCVYCICWSADVNDGQANKHPAHWFSPLLSVNRTHCNLDIFLQHGQWTFKKHDLYNLVIIHRQFNKNFIGFCFYVTICYYNIETSPSITSCGPEAKFEEKCENDKFRFPKRTDRLILPLNYIILNFFCSIGKVARMALSQK